MKNLLTFTEFLNESAVNERRLPFKGRTVDDLYAEVANFPNSFVFANGKLYTIEDPLIMVEDPESDKTFVYDEDGGEHEISVRDIEFIELEK
jgi:hypothetical protein